MFAGSRIPVQEDYVFRKALCELFSGESDIRHGVEGVTIDALRKVLTRELPVSGVNIYDKWVPLVNKTPSKPEEVIDLKGFLTADVDAAVTLVFLGLGTHACLFVLDHRKKRTHLFHSWGYVPAHHAICVSELQRASRDIGYDDTGMLMPAKTQRQAPPGFGTCTIWSFMAAFLVIEKFNTGNELTLRTEDFIKVDSCPQYSHYVFGYNVVYSTLGKNYFRTYCATLRDYLYFV